MQIESKIVLSSKLTVEGPLRLKEEYTEGMLESPTVIEEAVPEQLKGALSQATTTLQQLPALIKDTLASGLRIPLSKKLHCLLHVPNHLLLICALKQLVCNLLQVDPSKDSL